MLRIHNFSRFTICITVVLACLSCVSSASGQNAIYSDVWFDDSLADAGIGQVVGCGVTEGGYDDDHMYYVISTISSPNGRGMTQDYGYATPSVRADVSLVWDSNDTGDYEIYTEHWAYCPNVYGEILPYLASTSFTGGTYENGPIQTLDYADAGLISTNRCGYYLCPYENEKLCYNGFRSTTTHQSKGPGDHDNPCYRYVRSYYLVVTEPFTGFQACIYSYKSALDNLPGNPCSY